MSKPSRAKPCIYCGQGPGKTKDHVVPQCLFKTLPKNMITVKVCRACNGRKAGYDTYLRDVLVIDPYGTEHPEAREVYSSFIKSLHSKQSFFGKTSLPKIAVRPYYSPGGIFLQNMPMVPVNNAIIAEEMAFIVRGLFYHHTTIRIPQDYAFTSSRLHPLSVEEAIRGMAELQYNGRSIWEMSSYISSPSLPPTQEKQCG
jgi:hypothetical protein